MNKNFVYLNIKSHVSQQKREQCAYQYMHIFITSLLQDFAYDEIQFQVLSLIQFNFFHVFDTI